MRGLIISTLFLTFFVHANPWQAVKSPSLGKTFTVGGYANGCLFGGQALPLSGVGYQVIRPSRVRYYGHSDLIAFITDLGKGMHRSGSEDFLVADLAMPRGGHFSSGHRSHQTGLDADIWFSFASQRLSSSERESPQALSLVDLKQFKVDTSRWEQSHFNLLRLAASDSRTARIFVHPAIKKQLCAEEEGDREWLRKVRPWFGHHYHMHVRLKCPSGDKYCISQSPPPIGDGCGDELLSWWPKPDDYVIKPKGKRPKKIGKPQLCQSLIEG
ncbi:penicillin-insensitive murein endopeptidase [Veronia pacifica]|uniref:Penicillin-insensitive murein endopeptidase n=1 Tax=Veronia pacifica TaxID=1080227 RepID=A0A1C3EE76_9GAMM|nr:penicillin-insensitive murein endopeptidase [Veronia pacifica]ODA31546.1 penicillin-insensitive murein endopeptidase [Veronia pacifica]